jgi:hypothetical protein
MENEGDSALRFPLSNYCQISLHAFLPINQHEDLSSVFVNSSKQIGGGATLLNAFHLGSIRTSTHKDAIIAAAEGGTWRISWDID